MEKQILVKLCKASSILTRRLFQKNYLHYLAPVRTRTKITILIYQNS